MNKENYHKPINFWLRDNFIFNNNLISYKHVDQFLTKLEYFSLPSGIYNKSLYPTPQDHLIEILLEIGCSLQEIRSMDAIKYLTCKTFKNIK